MALLKRYSPFCFILLLALVLASTSVGQTFDEKFDVWPVDLKINGRIIVDNGAQNFDGMERFFNLISKNTKVTFFHASDSKDPTELFAEMKARIGENGTIERIPFDEFPTDKLKEALRAADVVGIYAKAGFQAESKSLQKLKPDFDRFLNKQGSLIVNRSIAESLGNYVLKKADDGRRKQIEPGLNLIPDCVLLCGTENWKPSKDDLLKALAKHPRSVGVGLENATILMLSGRKMTCYGEGTATFVLPANSHTPLRVQTIMSGQTPGRRITRYLLDLTEWRRDAIDRTISRFPPAEPKPPMVDNGTLVIVGGGGMPSGLMDRFIELAGGKEKAQLVYVPCSERDQVRSVQSTVEAWKKMGVVNATFVHTKDRNKANNDKTFMAPLKNATGIWFGGGRQWNFADSYYGTTSHKLMKEVLHRGGVIGGSSAGASIQARYLARATPIENYRIMAPGYERGGLGFLSGVAIDQHFSQRGRQKDMTQLVNRYPQLLGIGLDEATAIIVQKSKAEVLGRGKAHFYDRNLPVTSGKPDFIALPNGSSYDLVKRKVLIDTTKPPEETDEKEVK